MKYKNAKTQYEVTRGMMEHLEYKIAQGASIAELTQFQDAKIQLLDTLANLLINPEIAKAWEDSVVKENYEQGAQAIRSSIESINQIQRKMNREADFQIRIMVSLAIFAWVFVGAVMIYANLHK